ncbi:MAG: glycosyltransferase [Clostridia bacterium]|nr:glycosyltransferase [Clostridia bacterium]
MRILFITAGLGYGGAEKMLIFVAESLAERGHTVSIANINTACVGNVRPVSDKIKVYDAGASDGMRGLRRFKQLSKLKKIAKEMRADIIVGFALYPNAMARLVGRSLKIPSVMSERGDPSRTYNGVVERLLFRIINKNDGGVFQTEGAMQYYSERLCKKSRVIPNPIFVNEKIEQIPYEEREKTVVSVGRLHNNQKRYDVMLKAFSVFAEENPEYTLRLYGDGPDGENIIKWCAELGISDKVQLMGVTTTPMADICRDGMFLITSDYEGISNALLEAMATGLPCVSTDHTPGGARLLIEDGVNGLLAPMGDCEAIALAMQKFADDSTLAKTCGERAKEVVLRFAPSKIIDMWEEYLTSLL